MAPPATDDYPCCPEGAHDSGEAGEPRAETRHDKYPYVGGGTAQAVTDHFRRELSGLVLDDIGAEQDGAGLAGGRTVHGARHEGHAPGPTRSWRYFSSGPVHAMVVSARSR